MSDLHEDAVAADIHGKRSRNSGAGWLKSDVFNKLYAVEAKSSLDPDLVVDCGLLRLAVREGKTRGKIGVLSLAWIHGDPAYAKGLKLANYAYLVPVDNGPKGTEPIEKLVVEMDKPVVPKTYKFKIIDPRTGEWWRLLTPELAQKKLGKRSARLL